MMSWHRKLHQVPESSPESQISYPATYPWLYGENLTTDSPPAPLPEPPTEPPIAPPTTARSYTLLYGENLTTDSPASPPEPPLPSPPALTPALSFNGNQGKTQVGLIVGTVIGGLILLVAVGIFVIWYTMRNRRRPYEGPTTNDIRQHLHQSAISNPQMLQLSVACGPSSLVSVLHCLNMFSYEELQKATDCFSDTNFLGQGGYGAVHKGVLPDGKRVAIKQLRLNSNQGDKQFKAEVEIISRVHHKNLVSLVGYCISEGHRVLVYEFVPNGTLHSHLHGKEKPTINWPTRMKIALGSGKGLAYLHEDCHPQIIHRDIKGENILLDDEFVVKVADFGIAKCSSDTESYVPTDVKGTWGYLDPEYIRSQKLTDKADIFSFGVVLLELITGRVPNRESEFLYQWAKPLVKQALENGNFHALVDPRLQNEYDPSEMLRMAACAAACVRNSASNRPKMSQVVRVLEGNLSLDDLNGGIKPGDSGELASCGSNSYDTNQRNEDLKKCYKLLQEDHKQDIDEQSESSTSYESALDTTR